jgi:NAD(P)-dependent dehydrogenase (short-subunit alcohol dehydrogenase family)
MERVTMNTVPLAETLGGRTVLIVGGTSGIGLAAAIQAKASGAKVVILGSDGDRTGRAAEEHGFAGWRAADVTQPDAIEATLADIPVVDHLAMMAGTYISAKVVGGDIAQMRRIFDERIWGTVHVLRALGDRLSRNGSVVLTSGGLAYRPNAQGSSLLSAGLAGMEALTRGLALELAPRRFNAIAPGPIDSPLFEKAMGDGRHAVLDHYRATLPVGRVGTTEEAGAVVVFLLMANGFINGATLNVDGGARLV